MTLEMNHNEIMKIVNSKTSKKDQGMSYGFPKVDVPYLGILCSRDKK